MSPPPPSPRNITSDEESYDGKCYRQREVVDGNIIRVFNATRRPHGADRQQKPALIDHLNKSPQGLRRINDAGGYQSAIRPSVVVCESKSSGTSIPSSRIFQRSNDKTDGQNNEAPQNASQESFEMLFGPSGLPSPPPTPKLVRLPTPDLEPMEERPFCNCCGCHLKQMTCQVDDAVDSREQNSIVVMKTRQKNLSTSRAV
jgi:hypothetical protein